ncbi:hypothetical protein PR003_g23131 [Phytophthora rubi]|uniref:Peptidase A2 domain-containing protein n=1 Tax=Phytophthora rubi TaxID=129364 RepID=A0A6A4CYT3_9STRA|nr:hypothetical protein PR003_g23131 [Phytophthora rubi]
MMTDNGKERSASLGGSETKRVTNEEDDGSSTEAWVSSAVQRGAYSGQDTQGATKLQPGERLGWWSAQRFDRRARMRALVKGAVNDARTRILLDTGANISVISERFAKQLRLREVQGHGRCMEIQGFTKGTMATERRALVKVTLGWQHVYEFELWIMDHGAGVDVVLGTDFMIPAGVRLDMFHATARLPDEVSIPLIKTLNMQDDRGEGPHVTGGPTEDLLVPSQEFAEYRLSRVRPPADTHKVWVRRTKALLPTVVLSQRGKLVRMRLTNISNQLTSCSAHSPVLIWVPVGDLPRSDGYARLSFGRYNDWQLLAYEGSRDKEVFRREGELYAQWLASQPSAVERPEYTTPMRLLRRSGDDKPTQREYGNSTVHLERREEGWSRQSQLPAEEVASDDESDQQPAPAAADPPNQDEVEPGVNEKPGPTMNSACLPEGRSEHSVSPNDPSEDDPGPDDENMVDSEFKCRSDESSVEILEPLYVSVATVLSADANSEHTDEYSTAEHTANTINLEDYAHELAFLPDLTEALATELDYSASNVRHPELSLNLQEKVVRVPKQHEKIMISSGNALPPPAYGVVCDIDVQGHPPIKQKARRVPLRHLKKLYELLKGLLKAGLVSFSTSPWASPIAIVLKKNGVDIRLCIDYKMVNAVTAIMEYAMPLVDDFLTDLEKYLRYCSFDAASGFWAIMMTRRARQISAFVCALGHFEWLRMPFGLKNAPMIYQRMIDNALWGFVQPKGGWKHYAALMQSAEGRDRELREESSADADASTGVTKFDADLRASRAEGSVAELVNSPIADMFTTGEADASTLTPAFERRSFVDDICFGGESFEGLSGNAGSTPRSSKVDFLSHGVTRAGIRTDPKKLKAITELSFPRSKKGMQSFLGALNYYSRFIHDFAVYGYQVKGEDFAVGGDLSAARRGFATLQRKVAEAPILRHFSRDLPVHVTLFANEWAVSTTLMQEHDGLMHPVRFCGRVLKDAEMNYHPAEKEVLALLQLLKVCYTQLAGRTIHVYTRFSTLEWVHKSKSLFGRATQFAVLLSPWHLVVQRAKEKDCAFAQLLQSTICSFVDLEDSLSPVTPPTRGSPSVRMDPQLLYARLPRDYVGYVISFDGSAKTEKHGGYGSCAWILWRLPEWTVVIAASAYLETTTVNMAEYTGMNNGVAAALAHGAEDLVIVGDSRLAIQQSLGVIACHKESLIAQLNRHKELTAKLRSVKYLHAIREFNAAADSLVGETLESKVSTVVESEDRKHELKALNRIHEVIYEPSAETSEEVVTRSINSIRILETRDKSHSKNFFDFA